MSVIDRRVSLIRADNQSVMTHPTIGGDSTSLSNSVAQLVDERTQDMGKHLAEPVFSRSVRSR
jgi:hypothetical protein